MLCTTPYFSKYFTTYCIAAYFTTHSKRYSLNPQADKPKNFIDLCGKVTHN